MMYVTIESLYLLNDWLARDTLDVIFDWLYVWMIIFDTINVLMCVCDYRLLCMLNVWLVGATFAVIFHRLYVWLITFYTINVLMCVCDYRLLCMLNVWLARATLDVIFKWFICVINNILYNQCTDVCDYRIL